ncbi:hypothetical protein AA0472_2076 [Acetobacter estunensis NRIC 0472]|uniref:Uncharacterized protein n=1 Tax=Acetobacter estunensis TaxID=104097 RepID=A0A967B446_9PROT|nr:hypothetical protein [Acetobacter estunensis]NHO52558.1 hypothetical protein [Acetobacter estunensis]GBQ26321.1 hypothetical protein AA0472_2076 [Acetobacter estunensis NRIC 0472]
MKKPNFRAPKTDPVAMPPVDRELDQHPAVKLLTIGMLVFISLALVVYMGTSFLSGLRQVANVSQTNCQTSEIAADKGTPCPPASEDHPAAAKGP